jgi:catechol 2,3-dioxygenase-like lactoylglutathione lyase family enzyme
VSRFLAIAPRLPVSDLSKTVVFYNGSLGFSVGSTWPANDPCFAVLVRDDVQVQLVKAEPDAPGCPGSATISIEVDDAQALCDRLAGDMAIEWGPEVYWYGRREFAIKDPSGNLLIFSEPTDDSPTCIDGD